MERLHDRVEQLLVGIGGVDRAFDLGVDALDDVERQEVFDDHDAVTVERGVDRVGVGCGGKPLDRRAHVQ